MSRVPSFSKPEVLDRITDVFISNGYAGTTLMLLQQATGLGKQSLYNTFGDKQSMYLQAIDCTGQRYVREAAAVLAASTGRAAVARYFELIVGHCASADPVLSNCIGTNGLLEGLEDVALQGALTERWKTNHELLRVAVERGQGDGSIANSAPSAELAELLVALVGGLRVAARVGRERGQMNSLVALTLSVLDMH
jgi:AcrR family transcriptional regulator